MRVLAATLALLLVSVAAAHGQTRPLPRQNAEGRGRLVGEVVDDNGARVRGAQIVLGYLDHEVELESDDTGEFSLELPTVLCTIDVYAPGFAKYRRSDVRIEAGRTISVLVPLTVGTTCSGDPVVDEPITRISNSPTTNVRDPWKGHTTTSPTSRRTAPSAESAAPGSPGLS